MSKSDVITVYKATDPEVPSSSRWRWTRRNGANHKVVGASSEGYARKDSALRNIKRTQKTPYTIVIDSVKK
jgi:uncharacterized protein YegP (UPF0339 family)